VVIGVCDLPDEKVEPALSLLHRLQKDNDPYPDDPLLSGKFNEETLEAFRELESGGGQQYSSVREMFADMGFGDVYDQEFGELQSGH
jgi:hypothetical protein